MGHEYKPRRIRCRHCDGAGRLRANKFANGVYTIAKIDCYVCDGQGYKLTKQRVAATVTA